ncbi:MAG TPA: GNAT family N-acetyltransferase [Acidimicrobiia bacterium]|nr:GNAT family N-acetyltransferase [Acidimicrobiia bacterium]
MTPDWEGDVVLADGGSAHLRPVRPEDAVQLRALYESLSEESRYLRFFSPASSALAGVIGPRPEIDEQHFALVAEIGDRIVGVADYYRKLADVAEVAFTVRDDQHGRGLGTLLLDHLADVARDRGIGVFVAQVLSKNEPMRNVFRDAGFEATWSRVELGVVEVMLDLTRTEHWADAHAEREHVAEALSVARVLAPRSIAVVGASRRRNTIGNALVRNLLAGDFAGPVFPVNPGAESIAGVHAYADLASIPGPVDLAVVTVPAATVEPVVRDAAAKGVRGLVVITSGFAELGGSDVQRELVSIARRNGMRLVGPNCFGVVNTSPTVRMNATFGPVAPIAGRVGFASQSGGVGIEVLARARSLDLGLSTFVSLGNKADVSGNDLLQYWDRDPDTSVILLYVESFGNPRKFARLARRIARTKPIVALKSGRTPAGLRGASSHTAALANPDVAVDELFRQAGVIRVDTLEQLLDTAALLVHQPLPEGRRVGIVSNGGGPGILAADACVAEELAVPELSESLQAKVRALAPHGAGVRNPVDLVASAGADVYAGVLGVLLQSGEVDALLVIYVSPLVSRPEDVEQAVLDAAQTDARLPIVACFLGADGPRGPLRADALPGVVPTVAFPESAAGALAHAVRLAEWRRRPAGTVPVLDDVDPATARALVHEQLAASPEGAWLDPATAAQLLSAYGVPVVPTRHVTTADEARQAADDLGYPVALKAGAPGLVHKTDVGGVRLGLERGEAVGDAFTSMRAALGAGMGGAILQPMAAPGIEMIVGLTHDPLFGPLVLLGMGGVAAELERDTTLRIVPVTDADVHDMVRSLRSSPLLFGYRNTPAVDVDALERALLRVGRLADDLPEVVELDCNPLVVSSSGILVLDVKVRVAPHPARRGFGAES